MPGRFKLDENVPRDAQVSLLGAGHDAHTVAGRPNSKVLDSCLNEDRLLGILDLDSAYTKCRTGVLRAIGTGVDLVPFDKTATRGSVAPSSIRTVVLLPRKREVASLWGGTTRAERLQRTKHREGPSSRGLALALQGPCVPSRLS